MRHGGLINWAGKGAGRDWRDGEPGHWNLVFLALYFTNTGWFQIGIRLTPISGNNHTSFVKYCRRTYATLTRKCMLKLMMSSHVIQMFRTVT